MKRELETGGIGQTRILPVDGPHIVVNMPIVFYKWFRIESLGNILHVTQITAASTFIIDFSSLYI